MRGLAPDREGLRQAFAIWRGFPDVRHVIEDVIAAGDRVAVRLRAEGTHRGELFGTYPPRDLGTRHARRHFSF